MAITTRSSISVNARREVGGCKERNPEVLPDLSQMDASGNTNRLCCYESTPAKGCLQRILCSDDVSTLVELPSKPPPPPAFFAPVNVENDSTGVPRSLGNYRPESAERIRERHAPAMSLTTTGERVKPYWRRRGQAGKVVEVRSEYFYSRNGATLAALIIATTPAPRWNPR